MRRTEKIKIFGSEYLAETFDNVEEFYRIADAKPAKELAYYNRSELSDLQHNDINFKGLSNEAIESYKYGYPEGVEALALMPELNIKKGGVKYAYKWDENDGDDMSMERYYDGMACMRKRYKTTGENQSGRFVEIKINVCEGERVKYTQMLWKTYVACRVIDQLESAGVRVKVTVSARMRPKVRNLAGVILDICVKNFNQPLNISLMANVLSPWFFRHYILIYWCKTLPAMSGHNIGSASSFRHLGWRDDKAQANRKDLILIDNGDCLDQYTADAFIKALEL